MENLELCIGCEAIPFIEAAAERRLGMSSTVNITVPQTNGSITTYEVFRGSMLDPPRTIQNDLAMKKLASRVDMDDPLRCAKGCELMHRAADLLLHSEVKVVLDENSILPSEERWKS